MAGTAAPVDQQEIAPNPASKITPPVALWQIAHTFLLIGLASFSLAALDEARRWVTGKRKWFSEDEYLQGVGLAQLLPGAPSVNLCAYLGFRLRGLPGAASATLSFLTPCFVLMLLLSHLYLKYGALPVISGLFRGLGALVVGLVFNTILNLAKSGVKTAFHWLMAVAGFAMVFWLRTGVLRILLVAGGASFLVFILMRRFPELQRWTGSWRGFWHKQVPVSRKPGTQEPASPAQADFISACSRVPLLTDWRKTLRLVFYLALILTVDLLLIRARSDLMQMGSAFLRIGAFVFGSGYAMLPFIRDSVVHQFGWLTNQQFAVSLALSLITPGPVTIIGVFIGYKVHGVVGALAGMVNMYFPAWALTTVVAAPYAKAGQARQVRDAMSGIVAAFIGTLAVVLVKLAHSTLVDGATVAMAAGAFAMQRFSKIDTVWIVLAGALVSLAVFR
ncbi:MAG: chromate efflux transporter [Acidobacteriia bacterium]|nr:chromate efflux transporter [Terriglobia bacterium]